MKQPTESKNAALAAAKNEAPFPADSLLQEIVPLLEEYFIGEFAYSDGAISLSFPNGQTFLLTAQETTKDGK